MDSIGHLFVLWREPVDGSRHVVGHLWRDRADMAYCFAYVPDLSAVQALGFSALPEFARRSDGQPYRSPYLFPTFARRVPSPHRPDYRATVDAWGVVDGDDALEILAKSGGVLLTDRIELAEYRGADDDLSTPLEFRVAGEKHRATTPVLAPGDRVQLKRQPDNVHDTCATFVLTLDGTPVGYVPRQYSALIAGLVDRGVTLAAVAVRRLMLPEEAGRWVVRVGRGL